MAIATQALAQNCGVRSSVIDILQREHGEVRQFVGTSGNGLVVEMWANLDTGSWTATGTNTGGTTCIISAGYSFEVVRDLIGEEM